MACTIEGYGASSYGTTFRWKGAEFDRKVTAAFGKGSAVFVTVRRFFGRVRRFIVGDSGPLESSADPLQRTMSRWKSAAEFRTGMTFRWKGATVHRPGEADRWKGAAVRRPWRNTAGRVQHSVVHRRRTVGRVQWFIAQGSGSLEGAALHRTETTDRWTRTTVHRTGATLRRKGATLRCPGTTNRWRTPASRCLRRKTLGSLRKTVAPGGKDKTAAPCDRGGGRCFRELRLRGYPRKRLSRLATSSAKPKASSAARLPSAFSRW